MGAGCSRCSVGLPCEEPECRAADMTAVSLDVLARLQAADGDARRDDKYAQRLSDLQTSFARRHQLTPEAVVAEANSIRELYRTRRTLRGYLGAAGAARDGVQRCYESACAEPLECAPEVEALSAATAARPSAEEQQTPRRSPKCCLGPTLAEQPL
ncbi:Tetratricopeptide repeat protein 36 [Frankliniella fusca]|uniref:Tetratricopeptide repeat protein 36 n=1 Tax=Frankliniella fusca TaxID=407009 RepID=A0AAE1LHA7_9NEOP|nr:Tetratricopeptide repeat protein 36 [Frankliniella fusca]